MKIKLQQAEETFGPAQARDCDLLLAIGRERMSFAVISTGHELMALSEILSGPDDLPGVYSAFPLLSYPYRRVRISVGTSKFTLIPGEVFAENQLSNYARFVKPQQSSDVLYTDVPGFGIRNLAAVETAWQQTLKSYFPEAEITSQIDPFLCGISRRLPEGDASWYFNLGDRSFEAALVREGRLLFCNIFEIAGPDDFNYFLLLLLKEFPEAARCKAVVSGNIGTEDPFYLRLTKYFREIETADMTWVKRSERFSAVPFHHYSTLLNLILCG
ncbi:MAG TPA: DUF3822 family protein [Sphingobacteriaceae bacterium]